MATYYVAPYGDDANAGTSPGAPFRTINKAAQVMVDGDVCYVAPGVYRESVTIPAAASGIKSLTFVGDKMAKKFPGVTPGEVRLDGSDDDQTPVRSVGVTINDRVAIRWSFIDVVRYSSYCFYLIQTVVNTHTIEDCRLISADRIIHFPASSAGYAMVLRRLDGQGTSVIDSSGVASTVCSVVAEDCRLRMSGDGFKFSAHVLSRIRMSRILYYGPSYVVNNLCGIGYIENVVSFGGGIVSLAPTSRALVNRCTSVGAKTQALYVPSSSAANAEYLQVSDTLVAECSTYPISAASANSIVTVDRSALLDNFYNSMYQVDHYVDLWPTVDDGQGNTILPDFTPVGAQLLVAEEQNPIEGLRSARIDVPRVAYYPFKVAVSGANTITLKARKSHATGTTVKFRVDKDPNKVVTLADTDEVQTIQLGPVEDRGPRFVELEFWAQQVDYIPGHYVLIDSIQVL